MARRLGGDLEIAVAAALVDRPDRIEPVEIEPGIGGVLIVEAAAAGFQYDGMGFRRIVPLDPRLQFAGGVARPRRRRLRRRQTSLQFDDIAFGVGETDIETGEVGLDRLARFADAVLEGPGLDGQDARAGHGAEQDGIDDGAGVLGGAFDIEQDMLFRHLLRGVEDLVAVVAAVAHRHLLGERIDPVGRADQRGLFRADEALFHRPADFHQLGRDHHVDVAGAGIEVEHRFDVAGLGIGLRHDLDIVGRCARALGHAGDRGRLDRQAGGARGVDQPGGQHAAALAAHRRDDDGDRPFLGRLAPGGLAFRRRFGSGLGH